MSDLSSPDGREVAVPLSGPGEPAGITGDSIVGFSPTPNVWPSDAPVWVDEVQVAIELPMGPQGPDGDVPNFGIASVSNGSPANATVTQSPVDGAWYFTFTIPPGQQGQDGAPGAPLNFKSLPPEYILPGNPPDDLPTNPAVGDGYVVGPNLWVYGSTGWVMAGGYQGAEGPPTYAHVGTSPPATPAVGQIWFNPTAMGYVPTGLRVDRGAQFGAVGGYIWGDTNGELVFNVGTLPVSDDSRGEQVRLTANELMVKALVVSGKSALRLSGPNLTLGHSTTTMVSAGPFEVPAPTTPASAVSRQYADNAYISKSGDTITGQLTVPLVPAADGHAASKKYVDGKILYGPLLSVPASLAPGSIFMGY